MRNPLSGYLESVISRVVSENRINLKINKKVVELFFFICGGTYIQISHTGTIDASHCVAYMRVFFSNIA